MSQETASPQPPFQVYGSPDPWLVVSGHSHATCLLAAQHAGLHDSVAARDAIAYTSDWLAPTNDAYWDFVVEQTAGRTVAILWSGNEHNGMYLIKQKPPFRVYDAKARYELPDDEGMWISRSTFKTLWAPTFAPLSALVERLAQQSRVLLVGTPPPKSDVLVSKALVNEPHFIAIAERLGYPADQLEVTPAITRVALWRVLDELLQEVAATTGATYVPIPPSCADEDGVLLPDYDNGDATHSNAAYGALVWQQLAEYAQEATR